MISPKLSVREGSRAMRDFNRVLITSNPTTVTSVPLMLTIRGQTGDSPSL